MKTSILIGLAALALAGCDKPEGKPWQRSSPESVPADNSRVNERDRDPAALTPGDQGESEADRSITQRIRQDVVKDDGLSMAAKNVKIITVDGMVTLRGPVKSDLERRTIGALARGAPGVKQVDNQLDIQAD
jgi:hyperosmotically inducible periplasmic protein